MPWKVGTLDLSNDLVHKELIPPKVRRRGSEYNLDDELILFAILFLRAQGKKGYRKCRPLFSGCTARVLTPPYHCSLPSSLCLSPVNGKWTTSDSSQLSCRKVIFIHTFVFLTIASECLI